MTFRALPSREVEPVFMGFLQIYSGPLAAMPLSGAHASSSKADGASISTAANLACAKGALMALIIEMAAAFTAFGLYGMLRR
jgi:hypothetical protein